jgi:conjugative transfer region protein TrbK
MKIEQWIAPENIGFIAFGVLIGAIAMVGAEAACDADVAARTQRAPLSRTATPLEVPQVGEEFLRCAKLPIERADDPKCRALWAAQRRKFLAPGKERNDGVAEPLDLFPAAPASPNSPESRAPFAAPSTESE